MDGKGSRTLVSTRHGKCEITCDLVIGGFCYPTQKYVCGTWVLALSALTLVGFHVDFGP